MRQRLTEVLVALSGAAAVVVIILVLATTCAGQVIVHLETDPAGAATWPVDLSRLEIKDLELGRLRLRAYPYRADGEAWRIEVVNLGAPEGPEHLVGTPHREVLQKLRIALPAGWSVRWPRETGLEPAGSLPGGGALWRLGSPDSHPEIPATGQLLTGGLTLAWEVLAPGADPRVPLPRPEAAAEALRLALVQPGRDAGWGRLRALRGLCSADSGSVVQEGEPRTLGDYVLGGWSRMYPSAPGDWRGPVFWLSPRWSSGDLDNWHYALPAACLEEYLRRGDTHALQLGVEMARRLATVGLCRSPEFPRYHAGFWYEKGRWPGIYSRPKVEKAWDRSWVLAMLLTPEDPLWYEVYQLRRDRLLGYDPAGVWPERYGARRPSRLLENLADLLVVAPEKDRPAIRAQAQAMLDHVWSHVPEGQHYLQGDATRGLGSGTPLDGVPSSKLFMQLQWPVACARWMVLGVGREYEDRLRAMVRWQMGTWPVIENGRLRWPYAVAEDGSARLYRYETSTAAWAQGVLTLAAAWWPEEFRALWRRNADEYLPQVGPPPEEGLAYRGDGPGRLKTYAARCWALRDVYVPRR